MKETVDGKKNAIEIDLLEIIVFYLRKWWIIAILLAVGTSISLGFVVNFVTPMYQADISIYVNNSRGRSEAEYLSSADIYAAQELVNTYVSIAKSDRVLNKVAENLNDEYTAEELSEFISAKQLNETEIFCLYVLHEDPEEAARIANTVAEVAPVVISELIEGTSARVIDTATIPTQRHSPSYSRSAIVGGVVGVFLALLLLTIEYLGDTRIKDEGDLTESFGYPILGRIPNLESAESKSNYGYDSTEEKKETAKE